MARKYKTTIDTPHGPRRSFETSVERPGRKPQVARFGGIPLRRQKKAVLDDRQPVPVTTRHKELVSRLQTGRCEWCEKKTTVEVHQIRKLADLTSGRSQPAWAQLMTKMRRKTLVVCITCHQVIHAKQPTATPTE